jgi:hypothetical protein
MTSDFSVVAGNYTVTYQGEIGKIDKLKNTNTFVL